MQGVLDPLHLYLVKNLRGVIYSSDRVNPEVEVEWLKRRFRYRELGVSENLKFKWKWKRLVTLPEIDENPTLDSLLQASRFICPLLILKEESLLDFKGAVIAQLKTMEKLSDRDLKFNLRLVNYSITDFYLKSIELADLHDLDGRRELAEKDLKRFWRLKASGDGRTIIAYIDPLLIRLEIESSVQTSIVPSLILDFQ
jgi:hypothetical protein